MHFFALNGDELLVESRDRSAARGEHDPLMGRQGINLALALLGTSTFREYRPAVLRASFPPLAAEVSILRERQPSWLAEWAQWLLDGAGGRPAVYHQLRAVLAAPQVEELRGPGLVSALIAAVDTADGGSGIATARGGENLLAAFPDILDGQLWDLFTTPGQDVTLAHDLDEDRHMAEHQNWSATVVALAGSGRIPRDRVLDECLLALARDFPAAETVWFAGTWQALAPTPVERAARTGLLLALLGSPVPRVVSFALAELKPPARAGAGTPDWIGPLHAAVGSEVKGSVKAALALLDQLVKTHPECAPQAAGCALVALTHPAADLQELALDRVEAWHGAGLAEGLLGYLEIVSPRVRPRVESLLGGLTLAGDDEPGEPGVDEEIAGLPGHIVAALRLTEPEPGWAAGLAPGEPVLDPEQRVHSIQTVQELDTVLAGVLAEKNPADGAADDERVLDAALRWHRQPFPADLRPHARALERGSGYGVAAVRAWLAYGAQMLGDAADPWQAGTWLALPTHRGSWISPPVLAARLRAARILAAARCDADEVLALALTRLAPEDPAGARQAAQDVPGRAGELLRHALGGPACEPGAGAAWDAAEAVRTGDDRRVSLRHLTDPDSRLQVELSRPLQVTESAQREREEGPVFRLAQGLRQWSLPGRGGSVWAQHELAIGCPRLRGLGAGVTACLVFPDADTTVPDDPLRFFGVLLDPAEPLTRPAVTALTVALGHPSRPVAVAAADTIVATVEDGRLGPEPLAEVLRWGLEEDFLKANRLAQRLAEVASASPACAAMVRRALDGGLALSGVRANLVRLLTLFEELSAPARTRVVDPGTRALLAGITGSSGAAKAARGLLAFEQYPTDGVHLRRTRLVRARRWQRIEAAGRPGRPPCGSGAGNDAMAGWTNRPSPRPTG